MARARFKPGDVFYTVFASGSEEYEGGKIEPPEVGLSSYIVRTVRRAPGAAATSPRTVYAFPSEAVKKTKNGLVFEDWGREFVKRWREDEGPSLHDLHRSKSAAYRAALANLRKRQRSKGKYRHPLPADEFRLLESRLKGFITKASK